MSLKRKLCCFGGTRRAGGLAHLALFGGDDERTHPQGSRVEKSADAAGEGERRT